MGSDAALARACKLIIAVGGKLLPQQRVTLFDLTVIEVGGAREDDPAHRILYKALRLMGNEAVRHLNVGTAVAYPGGGAEQHGSTILFRQFKGVLYHAVSLLGRGGVKDRQLSELGEPAGVLLRLGGDRPGVVRRDNDHAALYAHIRKAHQRVRSHVEPDLFHGDKGSCAGISGTRAHLEGSLFIYRPFNIDRAVFIVLGNSFKYFCRGCAGVAGDHIHPCVQSAEGNSLVTHKKPL